MLFLHILFWKHMQQIIIKSLGESDKDYYYYCYEMNLSRLTAAWFCKQLAWAPSDSLSKGQGVFQGSSQKQTYKLRNWPFETIFTYCPRVFKIKENFFNQFQFLVLIFGILLFLVNFDFLKNQKQREVWMPGCPHIFGLHDHSPRPEFFKFFQLTACRTRR
jgi:hypothetical protein